MKEELNGLANHIASAKSGLPQEWQDWANEIEMDLRNLANREAQPVAYLKKSIIDSEGFDSTDPEIILHPNTPEGWHSEYQAVFTAPPAPVVNPEFTGATAATIPDKVSCEGFDPKDWVEARNLGQCEGWNAYRAELLAQPVSQGCKLPEGFKLIPIEMTDEIGEAIALEARCCGGIALCIYEAALAAAPEGGN